MYSSKDARLAALSRVSFAYDSGRPRSSAAGAGAPPPPSPPVSQAVICSGSTITDRNRSSSLSSVRRPLGTPATRCHPLPQEAPPGPSRSTPVGSDGTRAPVAPGVRRACRQPSAPSRTALLMSARHVYTGPADQSTNQPITYKQAIRKCDRHPPPRSPFPIPLDESQTSLCAALDLTLRSNDEDVLRRFHSLERRIRPIERASLDICHGSVPGL